MVFGIDLGGGKKKVKSESEGSGTETLTGQTTSDLTDTTRQTGTSEAERTGNQQQTGTTKTSAWTDLQKKMSDQIGNLLLGNIGNLQNAGQMTEVEQSAQNRLGQFVDSAGPAQGAVDRALTGNYQDIIDPTATENLYKSIQKRTMEDILPQATRAIAGQANLQGMLNSGPALKMQLENRGQIVNQLAETLANLKMGDETQRRNIALDREQRQLSAVPQATDLTLSQVGAGMQFGGAPRTIEQGMYSSPQMQSMMNYLMAQGMTEQEAQQMLTDQSKTTATENMESNRTASEKTMTDQLREWMNKQKGTNTGTEFKGGFNFGLG